MARVISSLRKVLFDESDIAAPDRREGAPGDVGGTGVKRYTRLCGSERLGPERERRGYNASWTGT